MTDGIPGRDSLSKNERRAAARDKAKTLRDQQRKKDKRGRLLIQGGVLLAFVAIVATVAIVLVTTINRPETAGPRNMASDGILIGENFVAKPTAAIQPGSMPTPNTRDEKSDVISIQLYIDYFCPICGTFEDANGDQIDKWVETGAATVELFPYAILDSRSQGTKYSTRAANAAACVADLSPDQFYDFHEALFAARPKEDTAGLSDDELIALTKKSNVTSATSIAKCITDQKFKAWVAEARERHRTGPIPNADVAIIKGTPTAIVNGVRYTGPLNNADAFADFVLQRANSTYNNNQTSSPTPTPVPTPSSTPRK
ncbi:MAG: DsbA family protein [Microbacteriaceae bacterium]